MDPEVVIPWSGHCVKLISGAVLGGLVNLWETLGELLQPVGVTVEVVSRLVFNSLASLSGRRMLTVKKGITRCQMVNATILN